jgi:hypothetical protein
MSNPRYPVYVISKGRWETRKTAKALELIGVPYRIVVEPQEAGRYAEVIPPSRILVLPFSNLGQGSIPARNWVWEHSISEGHARHWILDDNIAAFFRMNRNMRVRVGDGTIFRLAEDFTERFVNVPQSGFQYYMFMPEINAHHTYPFSLNTRVYSCMLLSNGLPLRWRGRYNEDTDLSLRILKAGLCTILFNAFLADKEATMTMKGGNTDELYRQDAGFDGRLEMALSLRAQHPDVVTVGRRWGRWQHKVDYRPFAGNRLIQRQGVPPSSGIDEHGMRMINVIPDRLRNVGRA